MLKEYVKNKLLLFLCHVHPCFTNYLKRHHFTPKKGGLGRRWNLSNIPFQGETVAYPHQVCLERRCVRHFLLELAKMFFTKMSCQPAMAMGILEVDTIVWKFQLPFKITFITNRYSHSTPPNFKVFVKRLCYLTPFPDRKSHLYRLGASNLLAKARALQKFNWGWFYRA